MASTVNASMFVPASAWRRPAAAVAAMTCALALAGCGDTVNSSVFDRLAEGPRVPMPARSAEIVPTAQAVRGHWVLTMPGTGSCGMTFSTSTGEGVIVPEGGCPKRFAASHGWTIEPNGVVIRDQHGGVLAALRMTEPGGLEGMTPEGEQVLLAR